MPAGAGARLGGRTAGGAGPRSRLAAAAAAGSQRAPQRCIASPCGSPPPRRYQQPQATSSRCAPRCRCSAVCSAGGWVGEGGAASGPGCGRAQAGRARAGRPPFCSPARPLAARPPAGPTEGAARRQRSTAQRNGSGQRQGWSRAHPPDGVAHGAEGGGVDIHVAILLHRLRYRIAGPRAAHLLRPAAPASLPTATARHPPSAALLRLKRRPGTAGRRPPAPRSGPRCRSAGG